MKNRVFYVLVLLFLNSCNNVSKDQLLGWIATEEVMKEIVEKRNHENFLISQRIRKEVMDGGMRFDKVALEKEGLMVRSKTDTLIKFFNELRVGFLKADEEAEDSMEVFAKKVQLNESQLKQIKMLIDSLVLVYNKYLRKPITNDSIFSSQILAAELHLPLLLTELNTISYNALRFEKEILDGLHKKTGYGRIEFNKVIPYIIPISNVVEEGKEYAARIGYTMGMTDPSFIKSMKVNGREIYVDSNGTGHLQFIAGKVTKGELEKKTWKGEITVRYADTDTTFYIVEEYMVKRKCR